MALNFSLEATGNSDWVPLTGPAIVRTWGTWAGSWQIQVSGSSDGANPSNVGSAIADDADEQSRVINHPEAGPAMYYSVKFTRTSGTLAGAFGNGTEVR